jgi:integrase
MYWFRKAIPADLRQIIQKREEKFSLRTKNPGEAQSLHAKRAAEIAEKWTRLRGNAPLDHADLFGLAGEMYRDMLAKNRNPGAPSQWAAEIEKYTRDRFSPLTGFYGVVRQNREFRYGAEVRKFLADRGYVLDQEQFSTFVVAFVDAAKEGAEQLKKNSLGGYITEKNAQEKYPKFEPRKVGPELDLWATWEKYSLRLKPATRKRWRSVMRSVEKRFGRDLAKLNFEDLVSWRDELKARKLHPTTISEVYLAAVKWILNRCVKDRKLLANVAFGIEVEKSNAPKVRDREFTMEEVKLILQATRKEPSPLMSKENAAARRWIPWILAYTGARLNEITQARESDLRSEFNLDDPNEPIWMLDITPAAGTVKTGMARKVPLHPHLIDQGFLEYAQTRIGLPLFYDPKRARKKSEENPYYKKIGERLGEWVHSIGIEKDVQPSHAWRHLFKSAGRYAQIPEDVLDTLQGHRPRGEGAKYGSHWPQMSYRWIKKIPRYEFDAPSISDAEANASPQSRTAKVSRFPKKPVTASTP